MAHAKDTIIILVCLSLKESDTKIQLFGHRDILVMLKQWSNKRRIVGTHE